MTTALAFPAVDAASDSEDDYLVQTFRPRDVRKGGSNATRRNDERNKKTRDESKKGGKKADDTDIVKPGSFRALGLSEEMSEALARAGYGYPTAVQKRTMPAVLAGRDAVVMARTGAGKTAAFLAPLVDRLRSEVLSAMPQSNGPRALVVAPTRELALQTHRFFRVYTRDTVGALRAAVLVGGTPLDAQFAALSVCPDLLIATPGRALQLLAEMGGSRSALTLATASIVVFDEADRLFEGTLATETAALLSHLGAPGVDRPARQTILVSATMPTALVEFSRTGLRPNVEVVRLDSHDALPPTLAVSFVATRGVDEKDAALLIVLRRAQDFDAAAIVFAATHRAVEYIVELLRTTLGVIVDAVHGNMDQGARVESVARFRKRGSRILVVTDVAARGIDLPDLDLVINYDFPATPKLFVHRVGRAARAGRPGRTLSFIAPDEAPYMLDVHLFLGRGVQFAHNANLDKEKKLEVWTSIADAKESTFVFGDMPNAPLDEEVELLKKTVDNVDIEKLRQSAKNAHGLYMRTRSVASGQSVSRAKAMLRDEKGGRRRIGVHPWFADMETEVENRASMLASQVSSWRPKESAVLIPETLQRRKRRREERQAALNGDHLLGSNEEENSDLAVKSARGTMDLSSSESKAKLAAIEALGVKQSKKRARQIAIEQQRSQFFVPLRRNTADVINEKGLQVSTGGSMSEGFGAFRAIQNAAMDINADTNVDLLRSKHVGANNGKYWDRVSKKYVKGGVTDATSKRNFHVASREARAKARGELDYSLGDGVMYRKWLNKNRKTVENMQELHRDQLESNEPTIPQKDLSAFGLGSNDFRKGSYGRRARVQAASAFKKQGGGVGGVGARDELKTAEVIKKERKLKRKAELRRMTKDQRKKSQKKAAKSRGSGGGPLTAASVASSRSSRVRIIAHGNRK